MGKSHQSKGKGGRHSAGSSKSPKFRANARREAEKDERKAKRSRCKAQTIRELLKEK